MIITDCLTLDASGLSLSKDGYLVGEARVSRAGNVQQYSGGELGLTGDSAAKMFGVYRDPDVVFDEASMMSLAGRPVTRNHPPKGVTAESWKDLAVGQMGGTIKRDGEHVVAPMAIMDAAAVKEIKDGARSLSAGYTVEIKAADGVASDGTPYQFKQAGQLRFNHVAYLPDNNPRAGNTRIGDGSHQWGATPITPSAKGNDIMSDALITVVLGDKAVSVSAADKATIDAFKADAQTLAANAKALHDAAITAKDDEIAKLEAARDAAAGKVLSDADLDKRVADRADLIAVAKTIHADVKTAGLSDADIRKGVIIAKLGDTMTDKPDAYIDARFDILAEDAANADPFADAMKGRIITNDGLSDADKAYRDNLTYLETAHRSAPVTKEA